MPLWYHELHVDDFILEQLGLEAPEADLSTWQAVVDSARSAPMPATRAAAASACVAG